MERKQKKVFIITIPLSGHVAPIIQIANELIHTKNIKCFIYSTENYQQKIESIGAEFRNYDGLLDRDMKIKVPFNRRTSIKPQLIEKQIVIIENNLMKISIDIQNEKPNLIFYESISLHAKYVLRFLSETFDLHTASPLVILFSTVFITEKNIYPNKLEQSVKHEMSRQEIISVKLNWSKIRLKSYQLSKKFKISYQDPYKELFSIDSNLLNIVFTFPELQPRSHLFSKNNKFIGSCYNIVDDEGFVDKTGLIEPFLKKFPIKNPLQKLDNLDNGDKLVYVSVGTIFTDNVQLYLTIINAFKDDESYGNSIEKFKLHIIVSVGKKCFEIFNEMLKFNELKLPNNMTIVPFGPQIEILKRASLFVTNAGIKSVSEGISFGVPMICIPVSDDQPQTAYRVTTELGLGLTLDFLNLKSNHVRSAVIKILEDLTFNERCIRYSKISREYDGPKNAADIICDFIDGNLRN
jgi:UDP:flavonoid glycosyltransferase YjiC (YdhE family)